MSYERGKTIEVVPFILEGAVGTVRGLVSIDGRTPAALLNQPVALGNAMFKVRLEAAETDGEVLSFVFIDERGTKTGFSKTASGGPVVTFDPEVTVAAQEKLLGDILAKLKNLELLDVPVSSRSAHPIIGFQRLAEGVSAIEAVLGKELPGVCLEINKVKDEVTTRSCHEDPTEALEAFVENLVKELKSAFFGAHQDVSRRIAKMQQRFDEHAGLLNELLSLLKENLDAPISSRSTFNSQDDAVIASNMRGTDGALTKVPENKNIDALISSRSTLTKEDITKLLSNIMDKKDKKDILAWLDVTLRGIREKL